MFDKLYELILSLFEYFSFSGHHKIIDKDEVEINLHYDEIYNIENPFIM